MCPCSSPDNHEQVGGVAIVFMFFPQTNTSKWGVLPLLSHSSPRLTRASGVAGDAARSDRPRGTWEGTDLPSGDDILANQFEELQRRHSKSELENASLRMQLVRTIAMKHRRLKGASSPGLCLALALVAWPMSLSHIAIP